MNKLSTFYNDKWLNLNSTKKLDVKQTPKEPNEARDTEKTSWLYILAHFQRNPINCVF